MSKKTQEQRLKRDFGILILAIFIMICGLLLLVGCTPIQPQIKLVPQVVRIDIPKTLRKKCAPLPDLDPKKLYTFEDLLINHGKEVELYIECKTRHKLLVETIDEVTHRLGTENKKSEK